MIPGKYVTELSVQSTKPLQLKINRGPRKGKAEAKLKDHVKRRLELLGLERALAYKALALTGLRVGEFRSITVSRTVLDGKVPHLQLEARDEKAGRGAVIPLRADLAEDLRGWLHVRLEALQAEARRKSTPIPLRLDPAAPLLKVPRIKTFHRDRKAAEIPKRDDRGRTVDLHALRHTFGTQLSRAGVAPRVAQEAMRHSTIDLTMNL